MDAQTMDKQTRQSTSVAETDTSISETERNDSPETETESSDPDFLERLLRDGEWLDEMLMETERLPATLRALLAVAVLGLFAHGALVGFVAEMIPRTGLWGAGPSPWYAAGASVVTVPVALVGAFLTATAAGLPSFYFYSRLAGVDVSFRHVTAQSLRALAKTSVVLLGVMPFYAAVVLSSQLGVQLDQTVVHWGLALPFIAGLFGISSVYGSFDRLVREHDKTAGSLRIVSGGRRSGLLFMVLAWGALFTTVAPVALWRYAAGLATLVG